MTEDFVMDIYNDEQQAIPISTLDDLKMMKDKPNGNYELVNDIDATGATGETLIEGIFVGKLNGNGFKVYGSELPTFNEIRNAYINDLTVEDSAYGLAKVVDNSKLTNVNVDKKAILISNVDEFLAINNNLQANYKLVADIDFSGYNPNGDNKMLIDGNFEGKLDGNGYTIKNLNRATLFYIVSGRIQNLNIAGFRNSGPYWEYVGALAKRGQNGTFENIAFDNVQVEGKNYASLLIGDDVGSTISNVSVTNSKVTTHNSGVNNGFLIGRKSSGSIKDVYLEGVFSVDNSGMGALVGALTSGARVDNVISRVELNVKNTSATNRTIGGVVGSADKAYINNSLFLGSVTGTEQGYKFTGATLANNKMANNYELDASNGIVSANGVEIKTITQPELTKDFYTQNGFSEDVWSYHTIPSGYPVLLASLEATEPPVINPTGGEIKVPTDVTMISKDPDVVIRYTLDGSTPTRNSEVYTEPIKVEPNTTVKAIAMKEGMAPSIVVEAVFVAPQKQDVPDARIDFGREVLNNLVDGVTYIVNGEEYLAKGGEIPLKQEWMDNKDTPIIRVGDDNSMDSDPQMLNIPLRLSAPKVEVRNETYPDASDGEIYGLTDGMEYRAEFDSSWSVTTGSNLEGLTGGTYYVRYPYVEGISLASKEAVVTVGKGSVKLNAINVTTGAAITTYFEGDFFDTTGMKVEASYNNGLIDYVKGFTVSPDRALNVNDTEVVITYEEGGIRATISQAITVMPLGIEGYYRDDNGKPFEAHVDVEYGTLADKALYAPLEPSKPVTPPSKPDNGGSGNGNDSGWEDENRPNRPSGNDSVSNGSTSDNDKDTDEKNTIHQEDGAVVKMAKDEEGNTLVSIELPVGLDKTYITLEDIVDSDLVPIDLKTGKPIILSAVMGSHLKLMVNGSSEIVLKPMTKTYQDTANHWSKDAISFTSVRDIFKGTSENEFSPEQSMTRGMILTVLARVDGQDTTTDKQWYAVGKQWEVENGLSDGTRIGASVTREELVTLLYRYVGQPDVSGDLGAFKDAKKVSSYSQNAMKWAVANGIIGGQPNGNIQPKGEATRAQVASIMERFIKSQLK